MLLSVIAGITSSMEMNAVDQSRLRVLFTITGQLGTIICCITGHLGGAVKTFHKGQLEWNYGYGSAVVATPWVMLTLGGNQCPG